MANGPYSAPELPFSEARSPRVSWLRTLIIAGILTLLMLACVPLEESIVAHVRYDLLRDDTVIYRVCKMTQWPTQWVGCTVLVAIYLLSPNRTRLLVGLGIPLTVITGLTHGLKWLIGRARPELNLGPFHFMIPGDPVHGYDAFPSGHVAFAVGLLALCGAVFPAARIPMFVLTIMTALTRVAQARHWASDVLAAALLAVLVAAAFRSWFGPTYYRWALRPPDPAAPAEPALTKAAAAS